MSKKYPRARLDDIKQFINSRHIAFAGISRDPKKFGNSAFKELAKNHYNLYPVHPELEEFEGIKCYQRIADLPGEVEALFVSVKSAHSLQLIKEAHEKGIRNIWLQQGCQNDETLDYAIENNINVIHRQCILMFANPVEGVHKFHRGINRFFGIYPK